MNLNFKLLPSLEHISLATVAVALWKAYSRTYNCYYTLDYQQLWNSVVSEVTGMVSDLPLPISLKEKILTFSKGLHAELAIWVVLDLIFVPEEYISMCVSRIEWTNIGTMEKKKTAANLVRNENLPITLRYELACTYCLVDDIPKLYRKIPDDSDYREMTVFDKNGIRYDNIITVKWTNYLRYGFLTIEKFDLLGASKASVEYFLEEKGKNVLSMGDMYAIIVGNSIQSNSKRCHSDIIIFLLEQMNAEQLKYMMHVEPPGRSPFENSAFSNILWSMVHWPWKYCFAEPDACTCRGYCDVSNFSTVLRCILSLHEDDVNSSEIQDKQTFFHRYFWQNLSDSCRKTVMETEFEFALLHLFTKKDLMNIEPILEFFSDLHKIEVFRKYWPVLCKDLVEKYNFNKLDLFIREFIPSREDMIWFKAYVCKELKKNQSKSDIAEALQLIDEYISGSKQSRHKITLEE